MGASSLVFKHKFNQHSVSFSSNIVLMDRHDIHIEYDIYVDGVYHATSCARKVMSAKEEKEFRLKATAIILKDVVKDKKHTKINNNSKPTFPEVKKVLFNEKKTIHEYTPATTFEVPLARKVY